MNTSKLVHQARLRIWAESFRDQKESGLTIMEWRIKGCILILEVQVPDEYVESQLLEIVKLPLASETGDCA